MICLVKTPPVEWSVSVLITNIVDAFTGKRLKLNVVDGPPFVPAAVTLKVLRFPDEAVPSPLMVKIPLKAESWNAPWLELKLEKSIAPVTLFEVTLLTVT